MPDLLPPLLAEKDFTHLVCRHPACAWQGEVLEASLPLPPSPVTCGGCRGPVERQPDVRCDHCAPDGVSR